VLPLSENQKSMNEHIFQSLIDNITQLYSVSEKELFNNEKNYESVERRQLFFYLCSKKNIPAVTIQKYLAKKDYNIHHSNILRGINRISTKVEQSEDYQKVISKLEFVSA
jgi:chromosomal replication initiation ATPase DnaA